MPVPYGVPRRSASGEHRHRASVRGGWRADAGAADDELLRERRGVRDNARHARSLAEHRQLADVRPGPYRRRTWEPPSSARTTRTELLEDRRARLQCPPRDQRLPRLVEALDGRGGDLLQVLGDKASSNSGTRRRKSIGRSRRASWISSGIAAPRWCSLASEFRTSASGSSVAVGGTAAQSSANASACARRASARSRGRVCQLAHGLVDGGWSRAAQVLFEQVHDGAAERLGRRSSRVPRWPARSRDPPIEGSVGSARPPPVRRAP